MAADDAFEVVTGHGGIAFVSQATALKTHIDSVAFKPLADKSLYFETSLVTRAEEKSRLVNQFAKAALIKLSRSAQPEQMSLAEIA